MQHFLGVGVEPTMKTLEITVKKLCVGRRNLHDLRLTLERSPGLLGERPVMQSRDLTCELELTVTK